MVSLTSLLVLASLFSQTSETIPKTAYLKLIDVWYIFLIVFDFLVIMDVVIIEYIRLNNNPNNNQISSIKNSNSVKDRIQKLNRYSKIIFCIILLAFLFCFSCIALFNLS